MQNPSGYHWFSVGTAETEDVLHLDVSDHGCNSGVGLSFTIVASHGLHLDSKSARASAPGVQSRTMLTSAVWLCLLAPVFPLATAAQAGTYDSNRENNIVLEYKVRWLCPLSSLACWQELRPARPAAPGMARPALSALLNALTKLCDPVHSSLVLSRPSTRTLMS